MTQTQQVDLYQIMYTDLTDTERQELRTNMYDAAKTVSEKLIKEYAVPVRKVKNLDESFTDPDKDFSFMRDQSGKLHIILKEPR